jgi:hypothetical protein
MPNPAIALVAVCRANICPGRSSIDGGEGIKPTIQFQRPGKMLCALSMPYVPNLGSLAPREHSRAALQYLASVAL